MTGADLIRLYESGEEYRDQARELARCYGGEVSRLMEAMHRAGDILDELWKIREQGDLSHLIFSVGYDAYEAFTYFCDDGAVYWGLRCEEAARALEAITLSTEEAA